MSNAALAADYFFLVGLIEQRLREQVADGIPVEGVEQMAQAIEAQDNRPFVMYVMWAGDGVPEGETARGGAGRSQIVLQRYVVWLRVANASGADKAARMKAAGPVLSAIHKAMAGWAPEGAHRAFARVQGPAPNYRPVSGLLPLAFEIQLVL